MKLEEYRKAIEDKAKELIGEDGFKEVIGRFKDYPRIVEWMYGNEKNKEKPNVKHAVDDLIYWFPPDKK